MNLIPPFTRTLPESKPNRDQPDWVACRFDGYPDFRSDLSIAGLRVVAKWPGEWAWCEDSELQALLMQAAKPAEPAHVALLETQINRLNTQIGNARRMAVAAQDAAERVWKALV